MNYEACIEYTDPQGRTFQVHVTFKATAGDMEDVGFQAALAFANECLPYMTARIYAVRSEREAAEDTTAEYWEGK